MRQVSNILMVTLIVAALFGGNCLSCPQMLMARANQPANGCCHHRTTRTDCPSQALGHFVKAPGGNAAPALAAVDVASASAAVTALGRMFIAPRRAADVAPPDPLSLQSLLRV